MKNKNIEKHAYIKLIELTLENNEFSIKDACEKTDLSSDEFHYAKNEIFLLSGDQRTSQNNESLKTWKLSPKAYFQYLEYLEFKHSVKSSKKSTKIAIAAIVISIIASTISIYFSNMQLNTPTKIEESQVKRISNEKVVETLEDLESTQKKVLNQVQQIKKQLGEYQKQNMQKPPTAKALE